MLRLMDFDCPPADLVFPLALEADLALRAVEQIAAILETGRFAAVVADSHGRVRVAILKDCGFLDQASLAQLGGDGVPVNYGHRPKGFGVGRLWPFACFCAFL
jgi:hypothetical protein